MATHMHTCFWMCYKACAHSFLGHQVEGHNNFFITSNMHMILVKSKWRNHNSQMFYYENDFMRNPIHPIYRSCPLYTNMHPHMRSTKIKHWKKLFTKKGKQMRRNVQLVHRWHGLSYFVTKLYTMCAPKGTKLLTRQTKNWKHFASSDLIAKHKNEWCGMWTCQRSTMSRSTPWGIK